MKPKKQSADWYIAATHWLTTFITGFVGTVILVILASLTGNTSVVILASFVGWPIMLWLGTIYSAKYLEKTYLIKNTSNIALLSLIYISIIGGGLRLREFLQTGVIKLEYVGFLIALIVFYFASKRYIKNNDVLGVPTQNL